MVHAEIAAVAPDARWLSAPDTRDTAGAALLAGERIDPAARRLIHAP